MKKLMIAVLITLFSLPVYAAFHSYSHSVVGQACLTCIGHSADSKARVVKKQFRGVRRR